ncbi:hypothetical protein [Streptomyces huasconensis]|uniref:hypothetical protein n=1 Tax=Streptomyces huasconensis TaxID=1854574 RepID=UPI0036F4C695
MRTTVRRWTHPVSWFSGSFRSTPLSVLAADASSQTAWLDEHELAVDEIALDFDHAFRMANWLVEHHQVGENTAAELREIDVLLAGMERSRAGRPMDTGCAGERHRPERDAAAGSPPQLLPLLLGQPSYPNRCAALPPRVDRTCRHTQPERHLQWADSVTTVSGSLGCSAGSAPIHRSSR